MSIVKKKAPETSADASALFVVKLSTVVPTRPGTSSTAILVVDLLIARRGDVLLILEHMADTSGEVTLAYLAEKAIGKLS